jgi:hypothetical protein
MLPDRAAQIGEHCTLNLPIVSMQDGTDPLNERRLDPPLSCPGASRRPPYARLAAPS